MARKATKSEPPAEAAPPPPAIGTRAMFTLPAADLRLLDTACLVDGLDRSAIVSRLIRENLADYYAGRRDRATQLPE